MDPKKRYRLSVLGVGIGFLALGWMNLSLHSEVENLSRRVSDYQENVTHWNQEFSRSLSNQETTIRAGRPGRRPGPDGLSHSQGVFPRRYRPPRLGHRGEHPSDLPGERAAHRRPPLLSAAGAQAVGDPPAGGDTLFRGTSHPFQ